MAKAVCRQPESCCIQPQIRVRKSHANFQVVPCGLRGGPLRHSPDCPRRRQPRSSRRPCCAGGTNARIGHATGADECASARPRDAGATGPACGQSAGSTRCDNPAAGVQSAGDGNQSIRRARGNDANNERAECTAGPAATCCRHSLRGNCAAANQSAGDDFRAPRCAGSNDQTSDVIGFEFGKQFIRPGAATFGQYAGRGNAGGKHAVIHDVRGANGGSNPGTRPGPIPADGTVTKQQQRGHSRKGIGLATNCGPAVADFRHSTSATPGFAGEIQFRRHHAGAIPDRARQNSEPIPLRTACFPARRFLSAGFFFATLSRQL
jgi:hypothetical protein